ncbi:hypothetical protein MRX96_029548 [Rhipicephalus microplus]
MMTPTFPGTSLGVVFRFFGISPCEHKGSRTDVELSGSHLASTQVRERTSNFSGWYTSDDHLLSAAWRGERRVLEGSLEHVGRQAAAIRCLQDPTPATTRTCSSVHRASEHRALLAFLAVAAEPRPLMKREAKILESVRSGSLVLTADVERVRRVGTSSSRLVSLGSACNADDDSGDHLTMKMVAPSKNSGVLEAVNTTGNTSRECSIRNPPRASGRTLLSDDDPDVPRHVSWSGP